MQAETSKCPWCGNTVPQAKFVEIEGRIRAEEKRKLAETEASFKKQYEEQARLQIERETKKVAEKERKAAEQWAKEQTSKLQVERDNALQKAKASEAKEAALKKQMAEEAERAVKKAVEAERKAAAERTNEQTRKLKIERDGALKKAQALEERELTLRKQLAAQAEKRLQEELAKERQVLEHDRDQREKKLKAEFTRDHEKTKTKVAALERQLQKKTSNELGDGAEIDLFEELRSLFKTDHFSRVPKGEQGADIHHEVYHKGQLCGKIVYDSKNRQNWQAAYASKLRADQTAAGAVHAILSTNSFPTGKKELCIVNDVIAVSPARVVHIVQLLRNSMVRMHILNLSLQERSGKMAELYKLISSEAFNQSFGEADKLTQDILDLDVKEVKAHEDVWKKRGFYTKRLKNVLTEMQTEISAIVERAETNGRQKSTSVVAEFRPSTSTLPRN
ncbi:MAG: hypothetical protein ACR2H4_06840 [Pyrinomonadaceae bacterium]